MRFLGSGLVLFILVSCAVPVAKEPNPLAAPPHALQITAEGAAEWRHRQTTRADLDGDGAMESVILAADVEVSERGPLWEDGHRWVVLVEDGPDRTLLYSAFVPNGFVEAAILRPSSDGTREVLIQERTPQQMRALTVRYEGPRRATSGSSAHHQIETWFPGSARLPD